MITEKQHRLIEDKAYAFDHNYPYYRFISGEPFLYEDNLFYYFDGRKLSVILIELETGRTRPRLGTILSELQEKLNPEAILVWGPDPLEKDPILAGWDHHILARSDKYRRDMSLHLTSYNPEAVPGLKEAKSIVDSEVIKITSQPLFQLTAEHSELLNKMIRRNKPDIFDRLFYASAASWLMSSDNRVFDARMNGRLMGFIIVDFSIRTLPMMLIGAYERKPPVFSDLLYDAVIRYCKDKGLDRLVFGHSYGRGLYDYKLKWGKFDIQPGVWEIMLTRASDIEPHNYPWLARVLRQND